MSGEYRLTHTVPYYCFTPPGCPRGAFCILPVPSGVGWAVFPPVQKKYGIRISTLDTRVLIVYNEFMKIPRERVY